MGRAKVGRERSHRVCSCRRGRLTMRARWLGVFASLLILDQAEAHPPLAIVDVTIIDVVKGEDTGPRTVLIADGHIAAIDKSQAIDFPNGAIRIDGRRLFLVPGLTDMHVHLFNNASKRPPNEWSFPLVIPNGVTCV